MRAFEVFLTPNHRGVGISGGIPYLIPMSATTADTLDISAQVMEIGPWQRTVEKELTKIAPSEQPLKIIDLDGSIWAWIQAHLPSPTSEDQRAGMSLPGQMYNYFPPYVQIKLWNAYTSTMELVFVGTVESRYIGRDAKSGVISMTPRDWSSMLANKPLAPLQAVITDPTNGNIVTTDTNPDFNMWLRPRPILNGSGAAITKSVSGSATSFVGAPDAVFQYLRADAEGAGLSLAVGMRVGTNAHSLYSSWPENKTYLVTGVTAMEGPWITPNTYMQADIQGLGQDMWDIIGQTSPSTCALDITLSVTSDITQSLGLYTISETIAKDTKNRHSLPLNCVDGIIAGDTLVTVNSVTQYTYTVLGVDAQRLELTVKEEVQDVTGGVTQCYWDETSSKTLVLEDCRTLINRAVTWPSCQCSGYKVDFSRWLPRTLQTPLFQWLPLRPYTDPAAHQSPADLTRYLTTVYDVDTALTGVRVYGTGAVWEGNPEDGYTRVTDGTLATPKASWTDHTTTAPGTLMDFEASTLAPRQRWRNRSWWWRSREVTENLEDPTGSATVITPGTILAYDYSTMSRIKVANGGVSSSVEIAAWSGTAFAAPATAWNWPGGSLWCVAPVPGHTGYLVGLSSSGVRVVKISDHTSTAACAIPDWASTAELKTTPWGMYLVGPSGYARIFWNSTTGTVDISSAALTLGDGTADSYFLANTFHGISATEVCCIARITALDKTNVLVTETHLLMLTATPATSAGASVITSEKLTDGAPATVGAVRDPHQADRVIGHCGGRLWSVSRTVTQSLTVERLDATGKRAMELLEEIGQITSTTMVADPLGVIHVVSRAEEPAESLYVDVMEEVQTYIWENFFSVVRCSAVDDSSIYWDAYGPAGGDILTIDQHPLIRSRSGCAMLAQTLSAWVGRPRQYREVKWFHSDTSTPAPWESLLPLAVVNINGDTSKAWIVYGMSDDKFKGEATVQLVQAFPS